ncbi:MAG: ATP-grasp domain-containing protein [Nitrospiraceae bacterium]
MDGHGNSRANVQARAAMQEGAQPGMRWIAEELLRFEREVSVLVVRGVDGAIRTYPLVDNVHEAGI